MSPSFRQPRTLPLALLLFATLAFAVLAALVPSTAHADVSAPYKEVPSYPKYGCYDVVTGGMGMWGGETSYPLSVDVPGPVVNAYFVWIGTEDVGAPNAPNQSDLTVNGAPMIGNLVQQITPGNADPTWYMWRTDVGPSGMNLVKQGSNKYTISGWNASPDYQQRRNGISLVVVYSTGACTKPNEIDLVDAMSFYWERFTGTTDTMTFTFPPVSFDRDVTFWLQHAGSDYMKPEAAPTGAAAAGPEAYVPSDCREMNLWARTGTGTPPPFLVNYYPQTPTAPTPNAGATLVVKNPFVGSTCQNTTWTWPVTSLTGWVDGQGWTPNVGGYITREWSIVKVTLRVPANQTFVALQLESLKTNSPDVEETGESGAWFGQAIMEVPPPQLKITKTDGVDTAKPGDSLTYTVSYENTGVTPTNDTAIVDELPQGASFVSASNGGVYDPGSRAVKWNLGTLAGGAKGQVTVNVKLDPVFPAGTTVLTNKATISTSTGGEVDLSDNTATDTTNVVAKAALAITKTGAPEPVEEGANLTYTIKWTVGGDAFSENVTVVDTLPANVTFVSASDGGTAAAGKVTWNLGNITPTKNGELTLVVKVDKPLQNGTELTNSATITNKAGDTATATAKNTVHADTGYTLSITKTNNLAGQPAQAGAELIWTLTYGESGRGTSPNAVMTDKLPAEVEFISASNGGTYDSATGVVTWQLGDLAPGATGSRTLTVRVKKPLDNNTTISNTGVITDDNKVREEATDTVKVQSAPILNVSKKNTPTGEVTPGDTISYEVCFWNTGNGNATNAVLTDVIPVNTTYVLGSAMGGATFNEATNTLSWKKADLGEEKVCGTFQVKVNMIITGLTGQANVPMPFSEWNALTIDNTASVTADGQTPKEASVSNPLNATVKPVIYKTADKSQVHMGDPIVFTVTVRNDGTATATNVVVTDQVPTRLDAVAVSTTKGSAVYDTTTRLVTVTIGQLAPAETVIITVKGNAARVQASETPFPLNNEAVVHFTEGAPRTSNLVTVMVVYFLPGEIPEPGTWLMLGTGLAGLAGYARVRVQSRRRKQQR